MISDQGDKISFFDINQSRFFVCSPSIKKISYVEKYFGTR